MMLQTILDIHAPIKRCKCSNWPSVPVLTKKLLRPSDTKGTLREYGIGTSQIGKPLLLSLSVLTRIKPSGQSRAKMFSNFYHWELFNYKCIYEICNNPPDRSKDSPLPPGISNKDLTVRFNNYFIWKDCQDLLWPHWKASAASPLHWNTSPSQTQNFVIFQPITSNFKR